jgi:isopenicillin-N epimerase
MASFGRHMLAQWALEPDTVYLNHGTVGAPPRRVLVAQQRIRDEIERQPARVLLRELSSTLVGGKTGRVPRLRQAAAAVAAFLGARGDDVVFVDNATAGVNAALRSAGVGPGDEILVADHAYGAVAKVAGFIARERGATVRTVALPWPPRPDAVLDTVVAALGPHTRVAIVDHVTSESALVMPLAAIASACRARGVAVLVDGAHAPGAIPVDIPALGVDWYSANLHKWAWSPRSCGILWAAPGRQAGLHAPVVSWGLDQGFTAEFDWPGTRDPSPALAAPEGLAFMRELGVDAVQGYDHALAWQAGRLLTERWGTSLVQEESQIGTMITVPLPARAGTTREDAARLRDALLFEDRIEVQLHEFRGGLWVRVSAQVYNEIADVERLADAVAARL